MSLDCTVKRKLPDWMLCKEKLVYNPVSLFTQSLVVAIRTTQHFELINIVEQLDHKEPITCVYQRLCWEVGCREFAYHTHVHSTKELWIYADYCWQSSHIEHVYVEKFDYVALSEEEIDAKRRESAKRFAEFDRARRRRLKRFNI